MQQKSLLEYFHPRIVAHRHWSVGLEIFVGGPSSERLEAVEGEIERILAQLAASCSLSKQIFPEQRLTLKPHFFFAEQPQVEGEGAQVGAVWLESPGEIRNANPYLCNGLFGELRAETMCFELGRHLALDLGCGYDEVGLDPCPIDILKFGGHFPLLVVGIEGGKGKGLIEVLVLLQAGQALLADGSHVPEAGDAGECKGEEGEEEKC